MTLPPDQLRRLVRRDVIVAGVRRAAGHLVAGAVVAARWSGSSRRSPPAGWWSRSRSSWAPSAFWSWAAGPREYLRDRLIVMTPVFLIAGPALIGIHDLGGGIAVGILSGAVGFSAAALLGLAWGSRRR